MAHIQLQRSDIGQPDSTEEPKIVSNFTILQDLLNGRLDGTNISDGAISADELTQALLQQIGVSDMLAKRRGKSDIATSQATTSSSLTYLSTPDLVSGITLPTDGLIFVLYRALVSLPGAAVGQVDITLNGTAIRNAVPNAGNPFANVGSGSTAFWTPIFTSAESVTGFRTPSDTSGMTIGANAAFPGNLWGNANVGWNNAGAHGWGPAVLEAAAGTYDVGIQFASSGGAALTVRDRKLWVWTIGF